MSFTIKVKEELIGLGKEEKTELSAIIKMSGSLGISSQGLTLSVITENAKIARHIYELLATFYQVKSDIRHHQKTNLRKNRVYTVFLDTNVEQILADLHLADSFLELKPVLIKLFYQMMKLAELICEGLFCQVVVCAIQNQENISWRFCRFILTMLRI
ncbi:hypothetical protein ANG5_1184 [Streptococcus constellatus subsp. pharyngis SK1060 = CCUG 46377]|uniref:Sporulation transcription regulator WhiA N-terminal domain-containing protein n=1 Tax=Streptococcus constellatus subsp. pharyngis SK1060 = CCUG 46377 TaxID=1035184 RepID=U2XXG4_STRCV|nr:hypothetical protein ANG5_1184 [Streptococcus constellatus subsp. pharyngis SK1060 = CCUG 46377]